MAEILVRKSASDLDNVSQALTEHRAGAMVARQTSTACKTFNVYVVSTDIWRLWVRGKEIDTDKI